MSTVNPIVISTWYHGERANEAASNVLQKGGSALDAVVAGAAMSEEDPNVMDVGYGGRRLRRRDRRCTVAARLPH